MPETFVLLLPRISWDHQHRLYQHQVICPKCGNEFISKFIYFSSVYNKKEGKRELLERPFFAANYHYKPLTKIVCRGKSIISQESIEYQDYKRLMVKAIDGFGGTIMPFSVYETSKYILFLNNLQDDPEIIYIQ